MEFTDEDPFIYLNKELCDNDYQLNYHHQTDVIEYDYKGKTYPMEKYLRTEELIKILGKIDANFDKIKKCIDIKNDEIDSLIKKNKEQTERINELEQSISTFQRNMLECVDKMDNGIRREFDKFNTQNAKYLQLQEEEKQEKEAEEAVLKTNCKPQQPKRKRNENVKSQVTRPERKCKKQRN
jgi:hypothetical protein